jgi:hypothetical protein
VLACLVVASGCSGGGEVAETSGAETSATAAAVRADLHPTYPSSECCEQAGLVLGPNGSQLAGDPATGCVWFEGIGSEARVSAIWPSGFTVTFDPLRVYDAEGVLFAEEGQTYTTLGGSESTDPPDACRQDASVSVASWRVGEVHSAAAP